MATDNRWQRLQLAANRLREIQAEAEQIYRQFPELDRRPKSGRVRSPRPLVTLPIIPSASQTKLH